MCIMLTDGVARDAAEALKLAETLKAHSDKKKPYLFCIGAGNEVDRNQLEALVYAANGSKELKLTVQG